MSQHADLLSFEIAKGIIRNDHATIIVANISGLLEVLEYDDAFTDLTQVKKHAYSHAKWMATQKDGLYGVTHAKLDKFLTELWSANQWISDAT